MKAMSALTLALTAGLCSTAVAETSNTPTGLQTAKSMGVLGHYYIKGDTAVFTPASEYLAAKASGAGLRAPGDDINGDGSPDYWVATNEDPCNFGPATDPATSQVSVDDEVFQGDHHLYKAQTATSDLHIESMTYKYFTDVEDTDTDGDGFADGNTRGSGFSITFWDKEDWLDKTTCHCTAQGGSGFTRTPIISLVADNMPGWVAALGQTEPGAGSFYGFYLTFDLAAQNIDFEIADSDGVGPASGFFNPMIAALDIDTNTDTIPDATSADTGWDDPLGGPNGLIDWSYSIQAIQPSPANPNEGLIGYGLAAPGIPGIANTMNPNDGIIDYTNRTDVAPTDGFNEGVSDYTRIHKASVIEPMGTGFPFTSGIVPGIPTYISRFSLFFGSIGQTPDPTAGPGPDPILVPCGGLPESDNFLFGSAFGVGNFMGGLNCLWDANNDTVLDENDGTPFTLGFLALSGPVAGDDGCPCDTDGNGALNVDDVEGFIGGFLGQGALGDCDGNGQWNVDDVECFIACFLGGIENCQ